MTYHDVAEMIEQIGVPYAYYQFPEGTEQACPFICFFYAQDNDFLADNKNYQKIVELHIELYTDARDFYLEQTVERVLEEYELVYSWEESFIDSEKMHLTTYTTEVLINAYDE